MRTIDTDQARDLQASDVPLINVLPPGEFHTQHIPDSVNVPITADDFESRIAEVVGGKDRTAAVYCASPECDASVKAAERLERAGFTDVVDYDGGTQAWKDAGHQVAGDAA